MTENRDEIAALSLAFSTDSDVPPGQAMKQLQDVARSVSRPPRSWTPNRLWSAYERLGEVARTKAHQRRTVADLLVLLRYELEGGAERGAPQPRLHGELVRERYAAWLARQEQSGATFTEHERWWLDHIVGATIERVRFDTADLDYAPFSTRNGTDGFLGVST